MPELGRLKRVDPRNVWKHEARDFTPWLRDNLPALGEAIGLELEVVETESPVGSYSVDIYAKDLSTGGWVIIENQLESTDHSHLGQLLTYASGKEAGVVIWISPKMRDEHRQALDWLNEITTEEVSFFGIELELLQINDSLPAPNFKLVSQPNEWRKAVSQPSAVSTQQQAYETFFTQLLNTVKVTYPHLTTAKRAYPQNWFNFPVGRTGFAIGTSFSQDRSFRVELYIDVGDRTKNKEAFRLLHEDRVTIEHEIGQPLVWQPLEDKRASRVYCDMKGTIGDDPIHLDEIQKWAVDMVAVFYRVFRPRVQSLRL